MLLNGTDVDAQLAQEYDYEPVAMATTKIPQALAPRTDARIMYTVVMLLPPSSNQTGFKPKTLSYGSVSSESDVSTLPHAGGK